MPRNQRGISNRIETDRPLRGQPLIRGVNGKMIPERLYKYLPSQYVNNVLKNGELLFRNLTYFRQYEGQRRGDPLEGHHRDNPDNDITITNLSGGRIIQGDFSFINTTDTDLIYVFCLSTRHSSDLYRTFNCDACIEITDVTKFILWTRTKIRHTSSCHKSGLIHGEVNYYAENKVAEFNIKEPKELAFAKAIMFSDQYEYRLVFGKKNAFKLVQKIIYNNLYDFRAEAMKGVADEKIIKLGDISDMANVIYLKNIV